MSHSTRLNIQIDMEGARTRVTMTRGMEVLFSADHVQKEIVCAVVRMLAEHWIPKEQRELSGDAA